MVALAQRKKRLAVGLLLTFLPVILWIALPVVLFVKLALRIRMDERLVEAYSFIAGAMFQLAAIYFLESARKKPWDWLSICAVTVGFVCVLSVIVLFGAACVVALQGW